MWIRNAIRNWRRKARADAELDEEVRGYAEMLAEEKIRNGSDAQEARREAKMELGGVEQVKEQTREVRAGHFFETLWQDVRYGGRMLRKNPGFTIVAVLTLALGIGANTAIFSVIESVLLRPLPYDHPQSLIEIWNTYLPAVPLGGLSPGDFRDWQRETTTVSEMAAYAWIQQGANFTGDGDPQRVELNWATSNFFPMLGVRPAIGRLFAPEEDRPGSAPVVVLSHRFWQSRFASASNVVGRVLTLDGLRYTVIGVLHEGSHLLDAPDMWMPMGQFGDDLTEHVHHEFVGIARLKPGVKVAQARAEFEALNQRSAIAYPKEHKNFGLVVRPMQDPSAAQLRGTLLVLFAAVGLVLLIACANIANLLLARNASREREIALRTALGAHRGRLIRQLLTESILLALLGGALGIAFAAVGVQILGALAPRNMQAVQQIGPDGTVFLFTIVICFAVGVICGLLPALQIRKTNVNVALKQGTRGSGAFASRKLHSTLVVSEIALALVPLTGAGLLLRSLRDLLNQSPGFRAEHLLSMNIPQAAVPPAELIKMTPAQQQQLAQKQSLQFEQIIEGVEALPGVKLAAGIDILPLGTQLQAAARFVIEGRPIPDAGVRPLAELRTITPGYFSTAGVSLLRGRSLDAEDAGKQNIDINEAMAERFWPQGNAIGSRINICSLDPSPCWFSIVGIVGNVHEYGLDAAPTYDAYFTGGWTPNLLIRTASDPHRTEIAAVNVIHKIDPALPVTSVMTMDELVADSVAPRRFSAVLTGVFAALALLLATVGIYGVMSYMVGRRTNEIGIRMALGARPRDVLRLVVAHGARLALIGVAFGICGSLALARFISSMLFGVRSYDPLTFIVVASLLSAVAIAACYVPARRAMKVDPMVALRYE
ncbi:MAG TPA: ABC transporter permease [Candidatus Acidoferrales bacterium]|nr:ABC transporter permease [Candidatus Acidoferrales bacterium]